MRYTDLPVQTCPHCGNDWCNLVAERNIADRHFEYYRCPDCGWDGVSVYDVSYRDTREEDEETVCPDTASDACPRCGGRTRVYTEWLFGETLLKEVRCTRCGWKGVKTYDASLSYTEDVYDELNPMLGPSQLDRTLIEVFDAEDGTKMVRYLGFSYLARRPDDTKAGLIEEYVDFTATMDDILDGGGARRFEDEHQAQHETTRREVSEMQARKVARCFREQDEATFISDYEINDETPAGFYLIATDY